LLPLWNTEVQFTSLIVLYFSLSLA